MISVIIPAYNVSPYLERCVQSIIGQTYSDLEIILVDDGSTDGTGELCDELSKTDSRIRVVHKENGGLSDARNAGIAVAKGEVYSFVDGDDYIELDTYEAMMAEMQDENVSIVEGGIVTTDVKGNDFIHMIPERRRFTKKEAFRDLFGSERSIMETSCDKLFRASLFQDIRYKKGIINEDMEILPRLLDVSNDVVLLNKVIYHYIKRQGGITGNQYSLKRYQTIAIGRNIYRMCQQKYPELMPYASFYELKSLFVMLENLWKCENRNDFKVQEIKIRLRILLVLIRCHFWKDIRREYSAKMKTYFFYTVFGTQNVERLLKLKYGAKKSAGEKRVKKEKN